MGFYQIGSLMFCPLLVSVWISVLCLELCWKVVARTHVWYFPLHHCMRDFLLGITNKRHQESNSDKDNARGRWVTTANICWNTTIKINPPIMVMYPIIEKWDACHYGDQCTTSGCSYTIVTRGLIEKLNPKKTLWCNGIHKRVI